VNDHFASATEMTGTSTTVVGWNVLATAEAGEPNIARVSGGHSAWWTWKAPATGTVTITTAGSDFDTTLGVFTGSSLGTLSIISTNDDEATLLGVWTSRLSFNAVVGVTYRLAVDGYHGATGNILLQVNERVPPPPPPNDYFGARMVLTGPSVSAIGSNASATLQSGEPHITGNRGGHSVWWSWTAPAAGRVTVTTAGSSFDTLLGVYTGTAVNRLTLVAANDDQNLNASVLTSRLTFQAIKGRTYQIVVDGYNGKVGSIALRIAQGGSATAARVVMSIPGGKTSSAATVATDRAIVDMLLTQPQSQYKRGGRWFASS